MRHRIFLCALLMICLFPLAAQQSGCKVTGTVMALGERTLPQPYASVYVSRHDSVLAGTLTDQDGRFGLEIPRSTDTNLLTVVFMGYKTHQTAFIADVPQISMDSILLVAISQQLEGVTVTAENGNKTIIQVETTHLRPTDAATAWMSGSVGDVLRTEPSVAIDANGNVSLRGNGNVLLLLDGVPTNLGSIDAIPTANIESIDIIKNPNATYDADGTGGIINIITKKGAAAGLSGMVAVNYGFNHFTNGSLALNYTANRFSFRFNYQVKYEDDVNNGYLYRYYRTTGDSLSQKIHALRTVFNNNLAVGFTVKPGRRAKIDADFRLILPRLNTVQELGNDWYHEGSLVHENRRSDVTWNRENLDGTVAFSYVIVPQKVSFSIKANVSKIWGHRPSYYFLEGDSVSKSVSGGSPLLTSAQTDWRVTRKYGFWNFGVKFSYRQNSIYHDFYMRDTTTWEHSYTFSNDLLHREYVPAAYVQLSSPKGKRFSWSAGLRAEHSIVQLKSEKEVLDETRHHFFLAPSFSCKYAFSEKQSLSLAYSCRVSRPTYPQLNPYMSMIDPHNFEQGNMHLKPETSNNVDLLYQYKGKKWRISTGLYFNYLQNYITQVARFYGDVLLMTYHNAKSQTKAGLDVNFSANPWKWMSLTVGTNTYYLQSIGKIDSWNISNRGWVNSSNLQLQFKPVKGMNLSLQYFLNTPQYYPQFTTRFSHYMNIGISQKFLKGSLTVSAQLTDVFNTREWEVFSDNPYYRLENMLHNKSRMVWLGVSYNFNAYRKPNAPKPESDDRSVIRTGNL